jgi:hypothetical protein
MGETGFVVGALEESEIEFIDYGARFNEYSTVLVLRKSVCSE